MFITGPYNDELSLGIKLLGGGWDGQKYLNHTGFCLPLRKISFLEQLFCRMTHQKMNRVKVIVNQYEVGDKLYNRVISRFGVSWVERTESFSEDDEPIEIKVCYAYFV